METKDRIKMIMERAGLSQREFASKLEISEASLSNVFRGATNPTSNHVAAIHRAFPDVSTDWLMFGEGEMLVGAAWAGEPENGSGKAASRVDAADDVKGASESFFGIELPIDAPSERSSLNASPQKGKDVNRKIEQSAFPRKVEIRKRKIKEIRVFYDDGTYETFNPA